MNIADRILETIKKVALEKNKPENRVTWNEIAVKQAEELNALFALRSVGISLESKEQKILALLLINHINNLDKSSIKKPELIEEHRKNYHKLLDKINEA